MTRFVWLRQAMPWLGPGWIYCVDNEAVDALLTDLRGSGFNVVSLDGSQATDAQTFHAAVKSALAFPDYYGGNWDAFDECVAEVLFAHPTALVWTAAQTLAESDLKTFGEAVAQFSRIRDALRKADPEVTEVSEPVQLELVLLGRGDGFRRPDDPVDRRWASLPL